MGHINCIPIVVSLFLLPIWVNAQVFREENIVEVDPIMGLPDRSLPFDQPFILKIPTSSSKVIGVSYLKHVRQLDFGASYQHRYQKASPQNRQSKIKGLESLEPSDYEVKTIGKQNYLLISVRNPILLDPGSTYTFFWAEDVSPKIMGLFDFYENWKINHDSVGIDKARKEYQKIGDQIEAKFSMPLNWPNEQEDIRQLTRIAMVFEDGKLGLYRDYAALRSKNRQLNDKISTQTVLHNDPSTGYLLQLIKAINQKGPHFDTELRAKFLTDESLAIKRLLRLHQVFSRDASQRLGLMDGTIPIDCESCTVTPPQSYSDRAANLTESIEALDELAWMAKTLNVSGPTDLSQSIALITSLKTVLEQNHEELTPLLAIRANIENKIYYQALSNLTYLGTSTFIYSFDTRTKLSITPDFGLVSSRLSDKGNNPYPFVPYLGFHINFRPINRDLSWKSYKHKWGHYCSLMVGYSMVPLASGPLHGPSVAADSLSGFFKDNSTLLTGLGFRLGNVIRITGGSMWHFKTTSNSQQVYDQRKLRSWLFLGVSLDLSLKSLMNGLSDALKGTRPRYQPPMPAAASIAVSEE
ncbi:hypothetical protein CLV98_11819 [Dyadobacter jejuensis]|uniref:Uncharacterized protein n=1 Tax=Dyadobacter jejuensis TaxID=1082580 RepID=A0A316AVW1_9BACT|nr:hypothetical protein [Dyadobacter jejuensis]PWJ54257.1 hypothetical protein CLV98_11819 [Dyadobacter jejuensis]